MVTTLPADQYSVIGPEKKFYGYVTGLSIEPASANDEIPQRLLATFEYSGKTETWEVPTLDLFDALWGHLRGNAWHRKNTGDWGYQKLWIWRNGTEWQVELP